MTCESVACGGQLLRYVTAWACVPEALVAGLRPSTPGLQHVKTRAGDLRWWLTTEFAPVEFDAQAELDGVDDDFVEETSLDELAEEARAVAESFALQLARSVTP